MKQSLMKWQNWAIVIAGVLITYLGFGFIRTITTNYDGSWAFVSILTTVIGLIVVTVGLSLNFEKESEETSEE